MADNYNGLYKRFYFMPGWRDTLEGMAEDFGIEYAQEALWNLMLVASFDPEKQEGEQQLTTDKKSIIGFIQGCVQPVVNKSSETYNKNKENGVKGGRPKKEIDIAEAMRLHDEEHKTWKEIAKLQGVSEDTLRVARKEYEKPKNPEIKTEKLEDEKVEKPKNPVVFSNDDKSVRETEKPKNDMKIGGFIF